MTSSSDQLLRLAIILLFSLLSFLTACQEGAGSPELSPSLLAMRDKNPLPDSILLRLEMTLAPGSFYSGEPVPVNLCLRNTGSEPLTLLHGSGSFRAVIHRDGHTLQQDGTPIDPIEEVYDWQDQAITATLQPGECYEGDPGTGAAPKGRLYVQMDRGGQYWISGLMRLAIQPKGDSSQWHGLVTEIMPQRYLLTEPQKLTILDRE